MSLPMVFCLPQFATFFFPSGKCPGSGSSSTTEGSYTLPAFGCAGQSQRDREEIVVRTWTITSVYENGNPLEVTIQAKVNFLHRALVSALARRSIQDVETNGKQQAALLTHADDWNGRGADRRDREQHRNRATASLTSLATIFVIPEELKRNVTLFLRISVLLVSYAPSIVTGRNSCVL